MRGGLFYKGWWVYSTAKRCEAIRHGVRLNNLTRELVFQMIDLRNHDEQERLRALNNRQDRMAP